MLLHFSTWNTNKFQIESSIASLGLKEKYLGSRLGFGHQKFLLPPRSTQPVLTLARGTKILLVTWLVHHKSGHTTKPSHFTFSLPFLPPLTLGHLANMVPKIFKLFLGFLDEIRTLPKQKPLWKFLFFFPLSSLPSSGFLEEKWQEFGQFFQ